MAIKAYAHLELDDLELQYLNAELNLRDAETAFKRIELDRKKEVLEHPKRLKNFDLRLEQKQTEIDTLTNNNKNLKKLLDQRRKENG